MSSGAVRAARSLCETNENWPKSEVAFNQMVAIIDRATAAPELLETVIAYRLHHKLMLQIADDTDCPCKICQMAEAVIAKIR